MPSGHMLARWNTHWHEGEVSPLVLRHPQARPAVPHMAKELLQSDDTQWSVRPGPRRIGKTTSLGHVINHLLDAGVDARSVVFVPLDQRPVREWINDSLHDLIEAVGDIYPGSGRHPLYLLLDEVQELPLWDQQLKTAWDIYGNHVRVMATGSSAIRLVRTHGASLAGRVRVTRMYAMKFREVVDAHAARPDHINDDQWTRIQDRARDARRAMLGPKAGVRDALEALQFALDAVLGADSYLAALFTEFCVWGGYPGVRPGSQSSPVQRLDFFESLWGSMVARDLSHAGIRDIPTFEAVFRHISRHTGGKFVPANLAKDLEVAPDTVSAWKHALEDLMLVQQLPPLKKGFDTTRGKDKAYLLDPGWHASARTLLGPADIIGQPEFGPLFETVVLDHARRLRYNLFHSTTGRIGYFREPEVDLCMELGQRWLLMEVKTGGERARNLEHVGGPNDIRMVISHKKTDLSEGQVWMIPAYLFALMC